MRRSAGLRAASGRLSVLSRIVAGTLGAHALTALATMVLSLILASAGMDRAEAAVASTLGTVVLLAPPE